MCSVADGMLMRGMTRRQGMLPASLPVRLHGRRTERGPAVCLVCVWRAVCMFGVARVWRACVCLVWRVCVFGVARVWRACVCLVWRVCGAHASCPTE